MLISHTMTLGCPSITIKARYENSSRATEDVLAGADLVIVTCAHSNVDYDFVARNADMVFDTKNAMKNVRDRTNIEVL